MNLQKNINYLKKKNNLSLNDIAKGCGMPKSCVFNFIHTDGYNCTIKNLIKLSDYFNVSIDDLIYEDMTNKII